METNQNDCFPVELVCGWMFFLVGIGALIGCIFAFRYNRNFHENSSNITAVITDIQSHRRAASDREYDVYVTYTVNGTEYTEELGYFSSFMSVGETIDILVNNEYPTKIHSQEGDSFFVFVLAFLGIIFTTIGGGLLYLRFRSNRA